MMLETHEPKDACGTPSCCGIQASSHKASVWGWMVPGAVLFLMPKCPLCFAAYVMMVTGVSLTVEWAGILRSALIALSIAAMLLLIIRHITNRLRVTSP